MLLLAFFTAQAATFTVDVEYDAVDTAPGDGVCTDAWGACTLRAAVMEANANGEYENWIDLTAQPYVVMQIPATDLYEGAETGDLDLESNLYIEGAGTVIYGNGVDTLFTILSNADVTLYSLELNGGGGTEGLDAFASAVEELSSGTFIMEDCTVLNDRGMLAGVRLGNYGTSYILDSVFSGDGPWMNLYATSGDIYVSRSIFANNQQSIYADGITSFEVSNSEFLRSGTGIGTLYTNLRVQGSTFWELGLGVGFDGYSGEGNVYTADIVSSTFTANGAHVWATYGGQVNLRHSTLAFTDVYLSAYGYQSGLILDEFSTATMSDSVLLADDYYMGATDSACLGGGRIRLQGTNLIESLGNRFAPSCRLSGVGSRRLVGWSNSTGRVEALFLDELTLPDRAFSVVPIPIPGSPAIDAGRGGFVYDIAGNNFNVDGNGDGVAAGDLGAYEYQP